MTDAIDRLLTPERKAALKVLGVTYAEWWFTSGRYLEARDELEKLRVSLARIAQVAGLDHEIPGTQDHEWGNKPFEELAAAARTIERGWNRLAACIVDEIEVASRDRDEVGRLRERIAKLEGWAHGKASE